MNLMEQHRLSSIIALRHLIREADEAVGLPAPQWGTKIQDRLFSRPVQQELLKRFRNPNVLLFFTLYNDIYLTFRSGDKAPLFDRYMASTRFVRRFVVTDSAKTSFQECHSKLRGFLRRIDEANRNNRTIPFREWMLTSYWYSKAIVEVTSEKGLFLQLMNKPGDPRWFMFRRMSERQEADERIRKTDPELYEAKKTVKKLREVRDEGLRDFALTGGAFTEKRLMRGHPPFVVGSDPVTREEVIFDVDGERIPVYAVPDEVSDPREARNIAYQDLYSKYRTKDRERRRVFISDQELEGLRKFSDSDIEILGDGDAYDLALTDDHAKSRQVTRMVQVKKVLVDLGDGEVGSEEVVVSGRFAGVPVADLVNRAGRLLEGTAYDYDPGSGRAIPLRPLERRNQETGELEVQVTREPYITVKNDRLYVTIPPTNPYAPHRNALKKMASSVFSNIDINRHRGTRMLSATFDPADFADIKDALGGVAMSQAAVRKFQTYFEELAGHEMALSEENLRNYTREAIGGFRDIHPSGNPIEFHPHQQESLAALEIKGWRGVIALDTGLGKGLVAIAAMVKMDRDAVAETNPNTNGRYLVVAPASLQGNIIQEVYSFVKKPEDLVDRIDTVTHAKFRNNLQAQPQYASEYIAIFIDEGDVLANPTSETSKAVQRLQHPHKIILTASPMKKDPKDARVLIGITNGEDYSRPEDKKKLAAFNAKYVERVGGRAMGAKSDPHRARDMRVFMRQNLFYRDKASSQMFLPDLVKSSSPLPMEPSIEEMYRQESKSIARVLKGMVAKWRDRSPSASDPEIESARVKFARTLGNLQRLSNTPDEVLLQEHQVKHGSWDLISTALRASGSRGVSDEASVREVSHRIITMPPGRREDFLDALMGLDEGSANALLTTIVEGNPKLAKVQERVEDGVGRGDRFICWTDSPDLAEKTVAYVSTVFPGKKHAIGLSDSIEVWKNGRMVARFRKRRYKDAEGRRYQASEWQTFVLKHKLTADPEVLTLTLTGSYAFGHNLQAFNRPLHLDRDTWNTQKMSQRTARSHRFGAQRVVEEEILDATFADRKNKRDATLDEIRGYLMELEGDVFDEFIVQAQTEALGSEWFGMKHLPASLFEVNRQAQEVSLSPYMPRMAEEGI